ncbi:hypothetical protein R1sor_007877 [Riccia sorocarpa]|uniref:RING-type domain-containing protein n=1 Tax=Riccia sorocarpa TaxID=122646 RepID=A0ABD3HVW4_9MARC
MSFVPMELDYGRDQPEFKEFDSDWKKRGRPDMAAKKQENSEMSQQPESCSVCLDVVQEGGDRSIAKLKCGHHFHLDCIGSAFNAKGAMQCPNCRHVEDGQWLYANGNRGSDEMFNEEVAFVEDDHDYFHSYIPDFSLTGSYDRHDREEPWNMWCPYPTGGSHPSYLSSMGDGDGTSPVSAGFLDSLLSIEGVPSGSHGRLFCPHMGHGIRQPRQIPEDSQTRSAAHGPDARGSSMSDGATVTERWSSNERGPYGWGRRSSAPPGQGGTGPLSGFTAAEMQHNNAVPGASIPDLDLHSGRTDASDHVHRPTHMPAWSSLASERQVGFLPYHLWEVYESVRLRRSRGSESTRSPAGSSSSYARVLSSMLVSNPTHQHQRVVDGVNSPTTSHGSEPGSLNTSSTTHGNSSTHGHVSSSSNGRVSWGYVSQRPERCDCPGNPHSGNYPVQDFYFTRQPGPSQSEASASSSSGASVGASASSSSSAHGLRRVRASLVNNNRHPGGRPFTITDHSRRMSSQCPWLNSSVTSQEPPPVSGMEWVTSTTAPWRRFDLNAPASDTLPGVLQAAADWRAMVMRTATTGNAQAAAESRNVQSGGFHPSSAPLTAPSSEGQSGSPRAFRGDSSRVPQTARWGVSHGHFSSAEVGPGGHLFRPVREDI